MGSFQPVTRAGLLSEDEVRQMIREGAGIDPADVTWPEPSEIDPATTRRYWTTERAAAFLRTLTHGGVGISSGRTTYR